MENETRKINWSHSNNANTSSFLAGTSIICRLGDNTVYATFWNYLTLARWVYGEMKVRHYLMETGDYGDVARSTETNPERIPIEEGLELEMEALRYPRTLH